MYSQAIVRVTPWECTQAMHAAKTTLKRWPWTHRVCFVTCVINMVSRTVWTADTDAGSSAPSQ